MTFKTFAADDLSPESLRARKAMVDANTPKPAPPAVSADGTKKSPFDLISVSKSPGMESLLSDTVKGGLEAKAAGVEGLPTGASSFATLKSFADRDALAGQGFLADYERRGDRDYSTARSALEKADRDAIDQVSRFLETHGLGRSALAGSNLGVSTELARVAGQASAPARNPALLAMANLDADRTNRLNAARMGTLGRDYAIQSNLAGFGRDARLDPARALAADLSNVGAANAIERSLRFENVGGMFDVPGANTPRF